MGKSNSKSKKLKKNQKDNSTSLSLDNNDRYKKRIN